MLIKEVCRVCDLTKKAVEYYERQDFIKPRVLDNGYREYSGEEITLLKEISVLRKCGIGVREIRVILGSRDKAVALARYRRLNALKMQKIEMAQACIDELIKNYDIEGSFLRLRQMDTECHTVQERMVQAFPGSYGLYVSLHFGRFLKEPIRTQEQRAAYENIIAYLDNAPALMPDELNDYLEQAIQLNENMENAVNLHMEEAIRDPDTYFRNFEIKEYIAYRTSEEFKRSPQGKMTELLLEFQKNSGYHDVFLPNLMVLSPAYKAYCERLEAANAAFLQKYPQAGAIYETK